METLLFGQTEMEYLALWVTRNSILPVKKKVEAIVNMKQPMTKHQVRSFIGLINYYRYTWDRCSHLLQPLTEITSDKVTFKWTAIEQKVFDNIKHIVACNILLAHPYFNAQFDIC